MWFLDRLLRRILTEGSLQIIAADGARHHYGEPSATPVTIRFTDRRGPWEIVMNPRLAAGELFMNGRLVVEPPHDVLDFLDLITRNGRWEKGGGTSPLLRKRGGGFKRWVQHLNWERASKKNVAHHYDLDDRLYDLFLDADRQYSCAYFTNPANTLDQAQADKKAHIAAKLALTPGQRVLDIGCGWGGMALYLNRVAGVEVLGITLSEEQRQVARRRAADAGVADKVRFELIDYRRVQEQLGGGFDRIVSVGMFEHVGPPNYQRFFNVCKNLLKDDGVMLLHTIGRMGGPGSTDAFTSKYIFPGGYNPALSEIIAASEKEKMICTDVDTLRFHYAHTLAHWYQRTVAVKAEIEKLYDERFYRLWQFYLAGALCAFMNGGLVNYQIQYARRRDALPIIRDYMVEDERVLRERG